ncbi:MAG: TetR/AcrR family transcriptional regulator [Solirubrobacterales bacterium]
MPVDRLPPGRHGLSRDEVSGDQRDRMLHGMAEAAFDSGYASVTVADVLKRAGVSRETFYEQFANKEDCFMAAYEAAVAVLMEALGEAIQAVEGGLPDLIDRIFGCYLEVLGDPKLAWTFLIEINAVGPAAVKQRAETQARGVDAIAAAMGAANERQRFACDVLFVMLIGLVTQRVAAGKGDALADLREPLVEVALSILSAAGLE